MSSETNFKSALTIPVLVAALGYFVDIYDLILFTIVRVPSLTELGVPKEGLMSTGVLLLNMQMLGMLLGGILWGILGDKKGRIKVLFGSIALYSTANIANGFVNDINMYAFLRFIAGVGLAGELGAGITLVSETLPKNLRGYGTTIVATLGVSGAVFAGLVGDLTHWRTAYFIGGAMGLALLVFRVKMSESGMFAQTQTALKSSDRGKFFSLFTNRNHFLKYLKCIAVGVPIWFVTSIFITFIPEFAQTLQIDGGVTVGKAIFYFYIGGVIGDFLSGYLSQKMHSRKKAVLLFLLITIAGIATYSMSQGRSLSELYAVCTFLGIGTGYWAVFVTISAEQFGTNLRATVATTSPNFVRGAVIPITTLFIAMKPVFGLFTSAWLLGAVVFALAAIAALTLPETYDKSLDYHE